MHFRPDIYELDSSGFILGQPLPAGEGAGSQRWTLEPIPYGNEDNPDVFLDSDAALAQEPETKPAVPKTTNFKPKKPSGDVSDPGPRRGPRVASFGQPRFQLALFVSFLCVGLDQAARWAQLV